MAEMQHGKIPHLPPPHSGDASARRIVRATVAGPSGVVPVMLAQRVDNILVLPSSFEVQNVGTDPMRIGYDSSGANFKTIRINTVYPVVHSPPGLVYIEVPAGSATYEFDIAYDRFR